MDLPKCQKCNKWASYPAIGLWAGRGFGGVQSLGLYESRMWVLAPGGQRRGHLRKEN